MRKLFTLMALLLFVLPIISLAEEQAPISLEETELKVLYIEESAKTRAEIKQYMDRKMIENEKATEKFVDTNFRILDARIDGFIRKAAFKLGAIWLSAIVFGGLLIMFIKRKVSKKGIIKKNFEDKRFEEKIRVLEENMDLLAQHIMKNFPETVKTEPPKKDKKEKKKPIIEDKELPKETSPQQTVTQQENVIINIKDQVTPSMRQAGVR